MKRLLSIVSVISGLGLGATTFAADGGGFNFRPNTSSGGIQGGGIQGANLRGGIFRGGSQPQTVSNQQQFFNQTVNRQQAFFAQPVFPHSNFSQTQSASFQPAFVPPSIGVQQVWVSPPVNNYLPPSFASGYQPGFYVAPTRFTTGVVTINSTTTYIVPPTQVYVSPQPTNMYYRAPVPTWNSMGRW